MKKCDVRHHSESESRDRSANDRDPLIKPPLVLPEDPHDNLNLVRKTLIALKWLITYQNIL